MRFNDISLFQAIRKVYPEADGPRGDGWLRDREKRHTLYRKIINAFLDYGHENGFPWSLEDVLAAWAAYGKQPRLEDSRFNKIDLICDLYEQNAQTQCFYKGRRSDECDDEVTIDRIKPGTSGGQYTISNCLLACQRHNSARGNRPFEEFLDNG